MDSEGNKIKVAGQESKCRPTVLVLIGSVLLLCVCSVTLGVRAIISKKEGSPPSNAKRASPPTVSAPTMGPASKMPTLRPTTSPTSKPTSVSYIPGVLNETRLGLALSIGLRAKLLAKAGELVKYDNGNSSSIPFHEDPDFGATFEDPRPGNEGGWIYVTNSEVKKPKGSGGVYSLTFDMAGDVIDYRMVLEGTTNNCGGGRTPWNSWVSCEETKNGLNWEVDPTGEKLARPITLGNDGGKFESFAYDIRHSHYFVTEDDKFGPLRRWIPALMNVTDPWEILHGDGETTFLRLIPETDGGGRYEWITDKELASKNANAFYPNSEGIDVSGNELFFVSKKLKTLFTLDLDNGNYTSHTTRQGVFDGQPDQVSRIIGMDDDLLYFTEDGGEFAGIHARDSRGQFFTILESYEYDDETTGLAFSPDGMHMYVAYQDNGLLFDITRADGLPFYAKTLNIKYHATESD